MILVIWLCFMLLAAVALHLHQAYSTFSKYGVKNSWTIPVWSGLSTLLFRREHFTESMEKSFNKNSGERFTGRYQSKSPIVIVRDVDLVKKITIKDFEHFLDRRSIINEETDPFFGRNLFSMKGNDWKDMRPTLSPAFTSSKMKSMVPFMVEVGEQMIKALQMKIEASGVNYINIDAKDMTTRFANDVIASCAFGLKVDSHLDEQNQFYAMGKNATTFDFRQMFKFFGFNSFPALMKSLRIAIFSNEFRDFFKDLITNTMHDRETHHIIRPDMIHLLMEAKKGKLSHESVSTKDIDAGFATVKESAVGMKKINRAWSNDDLVAQAAVFLFAGFETVSTAMSFLLHELAVNPDVQERLYQEIKETEAKTGGKFDYNSIQSMDYMDMVISEALRLWPPAPALERMCVKDYNMGKPNNKTRKDFILRKGAILNIPVWAFHRNSQFFPNPDKFDPERFSDENKHNIQPFTYMPFGLGPRNCIGSRFALCEVKIMTYQLLLNMEVSPCEKTCIPAKLSKESLNMLMEGGHWIRLKARK